MHQARELGLLGRLTVGWIGFNETLIEGLSGAELARVVTAAVFASGDPEPGIAEFVARVRRLHGEDVSVSYLAMTHYNSIRALQAAWRKAGEPSAKAALAGLPGLTLEGPSGPVAIDSASQHAVMIHSAGGVSRGRLHPAARASSSLQNDCSPLAGSIATSS